MSEETILRLHLLTLFTLCTLASQAAGAADLQALAAQVKPSVVHITIEDAMGRNKGSGTGFFISANGWVVTSDHVIAKASEVRVALADGTEREVVGVLARSYDRDVAILKIDGEDFPALDLYDGDRLPVGAQVAVMGGPLGLTWSLTTGTVSAYREDGLPEEMRAPDNRRGGALLQINAALSPGSSGSPVIHAESGKVVGVAASIITSARDLNFAIPVDVVQELMLEIRPDVEPQAFSALPLNNLIISAVFFALLAAGYLVIKRLRRPTGGQRGN